MKVPLKKYFMAAGCAGLIFAVADLSDRVVFSSRGMDLYNVVSEKDHRGKEVFSLKDLSYRGSSIPYTTDLLLSFNRPPADLTKDDSRKYGIRYASYTLERGKGSLGGGAAHFFKEDHRVEIETERDLWLATCSDLGSFTVEMRFMIYALRDGGVLFSSTGFSEGKKSGVEILIRGKRAVVRLFRLFKDENGRRVDVFLNRGRILRERQWYHFALSFDRISGKLATYINGDENEVHYVTAGNEPFIGVFEPSFSCADMPVAVAGKNFMGLLDELRISYRHIEDLKKETDLALKNYRQTGNIGRIPVNAEGIITSDVYRFRHTGTRVILFGWEEIPRPDTHVWMEFRISDDLFDRNNEKLKWYRIENRQRNIFLKKIGDLYLRGKYCQWRAHLISSPNGSRSPGIYDITLNYHLDRPPRSPLMLETTGTGDGSVTLRWKKNVEPDIAGYNVYYGIQPGKYNGVIRLINGQRISNALNPRRNHVEVRLTNGIIEENRALDGTGVLEYPLLKNDILYYFAVSAYDSYRVGTVYNHESELSTAITARPVPGSEINR